MDQLPLFNENAVVVLSGGQDSVTCLGLAIKNHEHVYAIGFDYGQKHSIELECAKEICAELKVPFVVIKLDFMAGLVTSALLGKGEVNDHHPRLSDLPASFVPNRNALFLTLAHAYAQEKNAVYLYTGVCQTDYSGYPDCRNTFILSLQNTLNLGYQSNIIIMTPLMLRTKAETFALAEKVGILDTVVNKTHTCYNGDHKTKHDWGFGCGDCNACLLREKGYNEFMENKNAAT